MGLIAQSSYLDYWHAGALNAASLNPRNTGAVQTGPRGDIYSADKSLLANSVPVSPGAHQWVRQYPWGPLTSGVVGYSSAYYDNFGLEYYYNNYLLAQKQPPQSWPQVLAPSTAADDIKLTLNVQLQRVAQIALAGRDGAVVALNPKTGAILAMYANPSYNPSLITSTSSLAEIAAYARYTKRDSHGFQPLFPLATEGTFPPGSTFKVITTAGAVRSRPDLLTKSYPSLICAHLPTTNKVLCNDGGRKCGGIIAVMLPESCDPGYGLLGLDLGGTDLTNAAQSFGYNSVPPLDYPLVSSSYFPASSMFTFDQPQLAYSAIGQENVRATALQNALVAAGIANGGAIMTPHLLQQVTGPQGQVIKNYKNSVWLRPLTNAQASIIVPLMENVVRYGTASGVGFLPQDDVAAKTGTAQTGNSLHNTDDWMIAFAPARNPVVAVAVVVPDQLISAYGATVAGPIVKCVIEGAIALSKGLPVKNTATTCHQ